jgi:hypothetical protein
MAVYSRTLGGRTVRVLSLKDLMAKASPGGRQAAYGAAALHNSAATSCAAVTIASCPVCSSW